MGNDCKLCGKNNRFDFRTVIIDYGFGEYDISCSGYLSKCNKENKFKFCPECGRKLNKEDFGGHEI